MALAIIKTVKRSHNSFAHLWSRPPFPNCSRMPNPHCIMIRSQIISSLMNSPPRELVGEGGRHTHKRDGVLEMPEKGTAVSKAPGWLFGHFSYICKRLLYCLGPYNASTPAGGLRQPWRWGGKVGRMALTAGSMSKGFVL